MTTQELVDASKCYSCFGLQTWSSAMVYLLNQAAGTGMTPEQLADASKCYQCIADFAASEVYILNDTIS